MHLGLSLGFRDYASYSVLEGDGFVTVFVETRDGPGVTGQLDTDVEVRVTTADFSPLEAVGVRVVYNALPDCYRLISKVKGVIPYLYTVHVYR